MNSQHQDSSDHRFLFGVLTGTVVGAGLALWLVPRAAAELRDRATTSARTLKEGASDQYEQATSRVSETVDEITRQARGVRDQVAAVVAQSAHEVERYAVAAKTGDRTTGGRTPTEVTR
jgi:gas vesicle protein